MTRRDFVGQSARAAAGVMAVSLGGGLPARTVEPVQRPGPARLRSSIAAYSFRDFFKSTDPNRQMSLLTFVDYCADLGCHGTELTSYYFPKEITTDYLIDVKRRAFLRGVAISGTAVGNNFARPPGPELEAEIAAVKRWVDYAALLGAPHIRVFAGDPRGLDKAEAKKQCARGLDECSDYAGAKGVFLGLENHGGLVADVGDLLDIVRAVKSRWLGVNLDTGNFYGEADPYDEMARLATYAVNVQLKVAIKRRGKPKEETDLARVLKLLREARYQGYVALEYEEENPWTDVPLWVKRMNEAFGG